MSKLIEQIEAGQMKLKVPDFRPGDTVVVQVKVKEGLARTVRIVWFPV